jgi:predicted TIM-barrel fold metal-dependent hydrolase
VVDIHFHLRKTPDANTAHLDGAGISNAILLTNVAAMDDLHAAQAKSPHRFVWSASTDVTKPEAESLLRSGVTSGAIGLGELKAHIASDGPELRRLAALAAELNVPILIHFQEVPHYDGEGVFSTPFKNLEIMLKAYLKTRFVGHADAFWANISADYANQSAYPSGPIKPGGLTDRLLSDYPNLYGDLSANSGNNALSRDPDFTPAFLLRHQDKLMFGSDCSCSNGHGAGISQANNPAAARLAGKCVARETLTVLKKSVNPEVFRKLTWENAHKVYRITSSTLS